MIISPDKGKLVERRGRKATGLRPGGVLATIAGLPKRRRQAGVPIVNYGVLIAYLHGIMERALRPFGEISIS